MKSYPSIEEACEKYVHAIIRAKERAESEEAFWKNGRANSAYEQMCEAIDAMVETGLHWWYTIGQLAHSAADDIREADGVDEARETRRFTKSVLAHLEALKGQDWVATLPLEHRFNRFPPFTDFGAFCLVNPGANAAEASDDPAKTADDIYPLLDQFRAILADKLGITFAETEVESTESYLNLGDHFYHKSDGYIPGRPQMVMKVGKGDEFVNKAVLAEQVRYQVSLLSICQIAYELDAGFIETNIVSPGQCRLPRGHWMQDGLIEVPNVAVAIVERTGHARLWGIPQVVYETQYGMGYDPDRFVAIWKDIAAPLLGIRHTLSGSVGDSIRNAVALVAKCRHYIMGDLLLNSVIAAETLLDPFHKRIPSDSLAVFAAKLTGSSLDDKLKMYQDAKRLYGMRNESVHRSWSSDENTHKENRKVAFNLFRSCLKGIVQWVSTEVNSGGECTPAKFSDFQIRTVLS